MASEPPPEIPPAKTQITLRAEGNGAWLAPADVIIRSSPPPFTMLVNKNGFARRVA
jgi:hypothetical protein